MQSNLYIKYVMNDQENTGFDLSSLGESFIGFNTVFKELFEISEISGELEIKTVRISEGSIITEIALNVLTNIPFDNIKHLQDFLEFTDQELLTQLHNYLSQFQNAHKSINDFFKEFPFDQEVLIVLLTIFITRMVSTAPLEKEKIVIIDREKNKIPQRYAKRLHQMVRERKFKKALKPIIENNVSEIAMSTTKVFKKPVSINESNFEDYLGEEEKILPNLQNGDTHSFTGEILALQSTRGEVLKFKAYGIEPKYQLLIAHPSDDQSTEDFMEFYKKEVNIKAEIFRKSLYKKPEIIIKGIELVQQKLI